MVSIVGNGIAGFKINGEGIVRPFVQNWDNLFGTEKNVTDRFEDSESLEIYMTRVRKQPPKVIHLSGRKKLLEGVTRLLADSTKSNGEEGRVMYIQ